MTLHPDSTTSLHSDCSSLNHTWTRLLTYVFIKRLFVYSECMFLQLMSVIHNVSLTLHKDSLFSLEEEASSILTQSILGNAARPSKQSKSWAWPNFMQVNEPNTKWTLLSALLTSLGSICCSKSEKCPAADCGEVELHSQPEACGLHSTFPVESGGHASCLEWSASLSLICSSGGSILTMYVKTLVHIKN